MRQTALIVQLITLIVVRNAIIQCSSTRLCDTTSVLYLINIRLSSLSVPHMTLEELVEDWLPDALSAVAKHFHTEFDLTKDGKFIRW